MIYLFGDWLSGTKWEMDGMALFRTIQMSFWTDAKISDDFAPEDRYFYLYLMTNPHTNLCGCYEITKRQMSDETGYTKSKVEELVKRLGNKHNVIDYCEDTKEVILLNWYKFNWTKSDKLRKPLAYEIDRIKNGTFKNYLKELFNATGEYGIDTVSIRYTYGIDTSCIDTSNAIANTNTNTSAITSSDSITDKMSVYIKEIIDYLNLKAGTNYRYNTSKTKSLIETRMKEGFNVDDFKTVIDNKCADWLNDQKMSAFLRPETLFGTKFESYLNERHTESVDDYLVRMAMGTNEGSIVDEPAGSL